MTIGFIVVDAPEFDILVCDVVLPSAIEFSPNVEIFLAFDIEHTKKLVISYETLVKFG